MPSPLHASRRRWHSSSAWAGSGSCPKRSTSSSLQLLQRLVGLAVGEALVEDQPLVGVAAVVLGQQCRHVQTDLGDDRQRRLEVRLVTGLERAHRSVEHLDVEAEADLLHLPRLAVAEHLAGAADLEVVHRQIEARAEFLHGLDRLEALACRRGQAVVAGGEQVGIGLVMACVRHGRATGAAAPIRSGPPGG
jgi:hypothetical protein